ncbi:ASST-domain-containing protein [Dactylonectria estremocensis]|uniref:ASST-domain-containing protein n=1 Tax=Dactylonectria estremocensis TaxID=1079267 RepID=A0A9P9FJB5_9HYPO|nr:ASST-domain-containing protein [Dactylonectria estremocensis]
MAPSVRSTASAVLATLAWAGSSLADTSFRSSDVTAPVFHVNTFNHSAVDDAGYIFMGSVYGKMGAGPMIFDAKDLSLVYADQHYDNAYTSQSQVVNGTRYLVFWEGVHNRGHANGYGLVFNENYDLVYNVTASGYEEATLADMHEMRLTDDSTALFTTYWSIPWNCTSLGGDSDGLLMDSGFQETDDGNYLISSRHLSLLALISGQDGHPIWVLGGRRNQFLDLSDGKATNFGWQHDARFYKNQSHITMFDNHGEQTGPCAPGGCKTRGLHLEIDTEGMTARIVQQYFHPERINSGAMGGLHSLDNGNVIIGWGYNPGYVEYTPDGKPVMDIQRGKLGEGFQADLFAYRVSKHDWTGRPRWLPSAAIDAPHRTTENATVYLSWNGATDIASWVVIFLGGSAKHRYMAAAALAADGTILGSTFVIDVASGQPCLMASHVTSIWPEADDTMTKFILVGMIIGAIATISTLGRWFWRRRYHLHAWDTGSSSIAKYERLEPEERRID